MSTAFDNLPTSVTQTSVAPNGIEGLKLYYDYTKWHVGLYASGAIATWFVRDADMDFPWHVCRVGALLLMIAAAACAGAICGTIPMRTSLDDLDAKEVTVFQFSENGKWPRGKAIRRWEKYFFWLGAALLVTTVSMVPTAEKRSSLVEGGGRVVCADQLLSSAEAPRP